MDLLPQPKAQVAILSRCAVHAVPADRHWFARDVMPFVGSLALHAVLVVLIVATVRVVITITRSQPQTTVPTAAVEVMQGSGVPNPGDQNERERAYQCRFPDVLPTATGWSQERGKALSVKLFASETQAASESLIGVAGAAGKRDGKGSINFNGADSNDPGAVAPFGPTRRGGRPAPPGIFDENLPLTGGTPDGKPPTVVYVIDASGSMVPWFDDVRMELRKAIAGLRPSQSFNVIFFQGAKVVACSPNSLMVNKPENREKANRFMDEATASNETDLIPAIETALRQNPRMVWLLTDGDFPHNEAVLKFIRDKNRDRRTIVNTIAFVTKGDSYERVLQQIATENGGMFRYVSENDLRR